MEDDDVINGGAEQRNNSLSQALTEKLQHFQEVTNIDDLNECKRILQRHAWNVESAVQSTFLDGTPSPSPQANATPLIQPELRRRNIGAFSSPMPVAAMPRTSYYEARSVQSRQPQGLFNWSFYLISLPFRFTWNALFGIVRFFIRLFVTDPRTRLIDPLGDVQQFITEYENQYGRRHPVFYRGTYADSQNDSRKQLKFLLVYLHDPDKEESEDFCKITLANNDIIEFVDRNFIFWACSINKPEGYRVSRGMKENTHPFLAAICLIHGKITIVGRFEGPLTPQEFLEQVSAIVDRFEPALISERAERAERNMTQQLRNEQDAAYQQSLIADKEKEEKKRREKEIKMKEEQELAAKQRKKEEAEENFLRKRQSCKDLLTQEPDGSCPDSLKLVIKLPDGSRLTRVFLSTQPVKDIHDYIFSQDNAPRQFQVVTNFPRKIIPGCSTSEILDLEKKIDQGSSTKLKVLEGGIGITRSEESSEADGCVGISIAEAGLKSCETLFVQALDDTDEESDGER